jgi:hypothetical protein
MTTKRLLVAILAALAAAPAFAQAPQPIRGTIGKIDGPILSVKQAEGPDVSIKLTDNAQVFDVKAAALADLKVGDYVGVGAMPQPDGSQKAIQVTIFAPSQRGIGEGFRPWDRPGSTMTNGTVDTTVAGVDGQVLTVKYKDGEQKIVIGPDSKLRAYVQGDKSELIAGAHIAIVRPEKAPDGSLQTSRVNVGIGGVAP